MNRAHMAANRGPKARSILSWLGRPFQALLRQSPSFYAFASGLLISVSVNLYTGIFTSDELPRKWRVILISALLTLVSAVLCTVISYNLETVRTLALTGPLRWEADEDPWQKLLGPYLPKLGAYLVISVVSAVAGLGLLLW